MYQGVRERGWDTVLFVACVMLCSCSRGSEMKRIFFHISALQVHYPRILSIISPGEPPNPTSTKGMRTMRTMRREPTALAEPLEYPKKWSIAAATTTTTAATKCDR